MCMKLFKLDRVLPLERPIEKHILLEYRICANPTRGLMHMRLIISLWNTILVHFIILLIYKNTEGADGS